jgi:transcriptional antiterminator NusG
MKPPSPDKHWFVIRANIKCEEKAVENLRLAGYETYYPRYRVEVKNKRTKIYHVRERPLMMRYLFVAQPKKDADWFTLRKCEGVEAVLGVNGTPIRVPFKDVERIFLAEVDMQFDDTRAARIHRKEEAATRKATLEMRFAKGTTHVIKSGPFESFLAEVEEVTKAGDIKAIVSLFGRLTPCVFDANQLVAAA